MARAVGSEGSANLRGRLWAWAPVAVWAGVVLLLSQGAFSASSTSRFLGPLLLALGLAPETAAVVHFFVRKGAHVAEYALLAFLAARAAGLSIRAPAAVSAAIGLALAVASVDEWSQSLDPLRTGTSRDVALDVAGAVAGALAWSVRRPSVR